MTEKTRPLIVSVVIPVFNRSQELLCVLSALARQSLSHELFEVLICDDGSEENLAPIIDEFRHDNQFAVRHLKQANQGAGTARNLGLAESVGELVAFTDSDCEPDVDWLSEIVRPFTDPRIGIVGGLVDFVAAEHISGRCVNFLMSSSLGAAGARDPRSKIRMSYYPRAGNLAVRRTLALAVGGFPSASHGEDLEFSRKVLNLGFRAEFVASARVLHNEKRTCHQVFREAFRKGVARTRLARQHQMHEVIHAVPSLFCLYLLAIPGASWLSRQSPFGFWLVWLPMTAYGIVLGVLAAQGTVKCRSVIVGLLVPFYAILLHIGYGVGYLVGWWKHGFRQSRIKIV